MNKQFINQSHIGRAATIIYELKVNVISKRMIHIVAMRGNYIVAYCYLRNGVHCFNRNRVLELEVRKRQEELSL